MLFADFWHAAYHDQACNLAPVAPLSPFPSLYQSFPSLFDSPLAAHAFCFALYLKPQLVTVYVAIPIREAHRSGQDTYGLLSLSTSLSLPLALTLPLLWAGSRRENSLQVRFTLNQNTPAVRFAAPIAHLAMILVIVDSDFVVSELGLVRDWFSCYTSIYCISNCLR